jgi:hypothetical protein
MADETGSEGSRSNVSRDRRDRRATSDTPAADASATERPPKSTAASRTSRFVVTVDNTTGLALKIEKLTEGKGAVAQAAAATTPVTLATPLAAGAPDPNAIVQAYYRGIADYVNAIMGINK